MRTLVLAFVAVLLCCAVIYLLPGESGQQQSVIDGEHRLPPADHSQIEKSSMMSESEQKVTEAVNQIDPKTADASELHAWAQAVADWEGDNPVPVESLQYLAAASRHGRTEDVRQAFSSLDAAASLLAIAERGNTDSAIDALDLLGTIADASSVTAISRLFSSDSRDLAKHPLRAAAVRAVGRIGRADSNTIAVLTARLQDPSIEVTKAAILAITQVEHPGHDGFAAIAPCLLQFNRPAAQKAALEVLEAVPKEGRDKLQSVRKEVEQLSADNPATSRDGERLDLIIRAKSLLDSLDQQQVLLEN